MSKDRTDAGQGRTLTEHGCGGGMPQNVSAIDWRFDSCPTQCGTYDVGNNRTRQRVERSQYRSEHLGYLQRWPTLIHIEQNRVADLLG